MRSFNEHISAAAKAAASTHRKRLGGYLVEAGLLTQSQVDVALNDQRLTGMRFGEILAARGWVKQQTIEYLMVKVILPEQAALQVPSPDAAQSGGAVIHRDTVVRHEPPARTAQQARTEAVSATSTEQRQSPPPQRREAPVAKPLPAIRSEDEDVSWVG